MCFETSNTTCADDSLYQTANGIIRFDRHEFVNTLPGMAVPCILLIILASVIGTFGNILVLAAIATNKKMRNVECIFIVNLALSDLYVTVVADPMSVVAKLEGEPFFDSVPGLCQTIASMCTISCVTSLMTIATVSVNRYFFICRHDMYRKIFTTRNSICISLCLYSVGLILVLLNTAGIGDHTFDRSSLECIWDRMATYSYTVVFSITLVWIPSIAIGLSYLRIYLYVRAHRRKLLKQQRLHLPKTVGKPRNLRLAKTLFIIFIVFVTCWAPYALIMVLDYNNTYPLAAHVYITMFAHLHPSLNWLIYYLTNKRFAQAYKELLGNCGIVRAFVTTAKTASTQSTSESMHERPPKLSTKSLQVPNRSDISEDSSDCYRKPSLQDIDLEC